MAPLRKAEWCHIVFAPVGRLQPDALGNPAGMGYDE